MKKSSSQLQHDTSLYLYGYKTVESVYLFGQFRTFEVPREGICHLRVLFERESETGESMIFFRQRKGREGMISGGRNRGWSGSNESEKIKIENKNVWGQTQANQPTTELLLTSISQTAKNIL